MARLPRPTIGVLAAWHVFEGTTVDAYLHTVFRGAQVAARDQDCSLLLACGVAPPPPPHQATLGWPIPGPDAQFLPVGPWNTDALLVVPNTLSAESLGYLAAFDW